MSGKFCSLPGENISKFLPTSVSLWPSSLFPASALKFAIYAAPIWFPRWLSGKESSCSAGDPGSIPRLGRSPGEGNGNPLQYSCLKNPMDRGARWATVHEVTTSRIGLSPHIRASLITLKCHTSYEMRPSKDRKRTLGEQGRLMEPLILDVWE